MKYGISYSRKVRTRAYEMLEISLYMEFDTGLMDVEDAFKMVRDKVDKWIESERERIFMKEGRRLSGYEGEEDTEVEGD